MSFDVDVAVIGAGVVGLAIASELAQQQRSVFVFEKNRSFGQETSSRNSEVIHAGLYYPENSLKAQLCVEGNTLLYEICKKNSIPHKKVGKIIVAVKDEDTQKLSDIYEQAMKNGVTNLQLLSQAETLKLEPNIDAKAGLLSPSTGIIDTHSLMQYFYSNAISHDAQFLFESEVIDIETSGQGCVIAIRDWEGISEITAQAVVNSAGLDSDRIAQIAGIDISTAGYKLHFCKGEYFGLSSRWRNVVSRLVYPTPEHASLGVHIVLALDGMIRLGPNARYIDSIDYKVDNTAKKAFYQSAEKFLPYIELDDLHPDFAGIRPKLQGPEDTFRDFVIAHEDSKGCPGLINLIGIESPGLTASPAIARLVAKMTEDILN